MPNKYLTTTSPAAITSALASNCLTPADYDRFIYLNPPQLLKTPEAQKIIREYLEKLEDGRRLAKKKSLQNVLYNSARTAFIAYVPDPHDISGGVDSSYLDRFSDGGICKNEEGLFLMDATLASRFPEYTQKMNKLQADIEQDEENKEYKDVEID